MKTKEKEPAQMKIQAIGSLFYLAMFLIPGFDYRFSWSAVPVLIVIASNAAVFLGYMLFFLVLRENSFASRVVQVDEGQRVITTGPYSLVRHPMHV